MALQVSGRQTNGAFALAELTLAPGARADDAHVLTGADVAVLVRSGRLRARLGSEHLTLGPGEVLYASTGHPHALANPFEDPLVLTHLLAPSGFETVWTAMATHLATAGAPASTRQVQRWWDEHGATAAPPVADPWDRC